MIQGAVRRALQGAFTENLGLKAIAFLASLALFAAVRGGEDAQRTVYVDVVTLAPPQTSDRVLVVDVPDQVRLEVQGPRGIVNELRSEDIPPVQVDLRYADDRGYDFSESSFQLPAGVRIRAISPTSFPVRWERRETRRLRVTPLLHGSPAGGFARKGDAAVVPPEVVLIGAREAVLQAEAAHTEAIEIEGLGAGRYTRDARLRRPPAHTWYEQDGRVTVHFEIAADLVERRLDAVPVRVVQTSWRAEVQPDTVEIVLRGTRAAMAALRPERVVPFVDGSALETRGPGTYREAPEIGELPPGVEVASTTPEHVFVDMRRPR